MQFPLEIQSHLSKVLHDTGTIRSAWRCGHFSRHSSILHQRWVPVFEHDFKFSSFLRVFTKPASQLRMDMPKLRPYVPDESTYSRSVAIELQIGSYPTSGPRLPNIATDEQDSVPPRTQVTIPVSRCPMPSIQRAEGYSYSYTPCWEAKPVWRQE